jgi:hypothetical protein
MPSLPVALFRQQRPEFDLLPDSQIVLAIEEAERALSREVFGDQWPDVVSLQAARNLADGPAGQQAKLQLDDGTTIYDRALRRIKQAHSMGYRVP